MASGPGEYLSSAEKTIENQSFVYLAAQGSLRRAFAAAAILRAEMDRNITAHLYIPPQGDARLTRRMAHAAGLSPLDLGLRIALRLRCLKAWERAVAANDFSVVAAPLQALADHVRKDGAARASALGLSSPYAAIIDGHTPGLRLRDLNAWAEELQSFCRKALPLVNRDTGYDPRLAMDLADQKNLARMLAVKMGLDPQILADTPHPVTLGTGRDVRIGMAFRPENFAQSMLDLMHECGHAVYRGALPPGARGTGTAMDEAMALMVENHAARRPIFAFNLCAAAAEMELPSLKVDINAASLFAAFLNNRSSKLRAQAHEIAYPLHVILRMRIERMVLDDNMPVRDIPRVWAELHQELIDTDPPQNDRDGALQDIHWYADQWGWFPQYLAGMLAAAQFYETAVEKTPAIGDAVTQGRMAPLRDWIAGKISHSGDRHDFSTLIESLTRAPLDTFAWINHAVTRYTPGKWAHYNLDYLKPGLTD
ncbi:MAG: hypothetical protein HYU57_01140 [Micavibrio aeruginosavorus]|nr:hypothetical protein [Micavibrio aeruginosavorus]